jgi:hypothetical protein
LKAAVSRDEWKETFEKILAHTATKGYCRTKLTKIYLWEQMFDAALEEVMPKKASKA